MSNGIGHNGKLDALAAVLAQQFPSATPKQIQMEAKTILDGWKVAVQLSQWEGQERKPEKDIEGFRLVIGNLKRAAEALEQIGLHGAKNLAPLANDLIRREHGHQHPFDSFQSARVVAGELRRIAGAVEEAKSEVGRSLAPALSGLSGSDEYPGRGAKFDTEANHVAYEVAGAFWRLTGKKPGTSVASDRPNSPRGGQFADLLGSVFAVLSIEASAAKRAEKAGQKFQPK